MKANNFDSFDPLSIFWFWWTSKQASDTNGIHEAVSMWQLLFSIKPASRTLKPSDASSSKSRKWHKENLNSYRNVIDHVFKTNALDNFPAKLVSEIFRFTQPPNWHWRSTQRICETRHSDAPSTSITKSWRGYSLKDHLDLFATACTRTAF